MKKTEKKKASLLSPRLEAAFKEYNSFHKHPLNKLTHYFGITLIVIGLLGLLSGFPMGPQDWVISEYFRFDAGTVLIFLAALRYFYLDWKISFPFLFIIFGLYFLGRALPTYLNELFFVLGWVLQAIGHAVFEKKSPAFFKNVTHLLIGPLWIFARLIDYR